jgi:5-methylcytosine-specific restriction enzyme A
LNLWFELLQEEAGTVFQKLNMKQTAKDLREIGGSTVQIRRALSADEAVRTAFEESLSVRVIVNDGDRRTERSRGASKVKARNLDPEAWHVGAYDYVSGNAVIVRGPRGSRYVDQFTLEDPAVLEAPKSREVTATVFERDPRVRAAVLTRAQGRCECCGEPGFSMPNGAVYLETHHVIPLSEGGPDAESNVVALCPNHHRRAHHGLDRAELRSTLQQYLARLGAPDACPGATAKDR